MHFVANSKFIDVLKLLHKGRFIKQLQNIGELRICNQVQNGFDKRCLVWCSKSCISSVGQTKKLYHPIMHSALIFGLPAQKILIWTTVQCLISNFRGIRLVIEAWAFKMNYWWGMKRMQLFTTTQAFLNNDFSNFLWMFVD